MTQCSETLFPCEAHFSRQVVAQFEGSWLTTEGGSLLLRQADRKIGFPKKLLKNTAKSCSEENSCSTRIMLFSRSACFARQRSW